MVKKWCPLQRKVLKPVEGQLNIAEYSSHTVLQNVRGEAVVNLRDFIIFALYVVFVSTSN